VLKSGKLPLVPLLPLVSLIGHFEKNLNNPWFYGAFLLSLPFRVSEKGKSEK